MFQQLKDFVMGMSNTQKAIFVVALLAAIWYFFIRPSTHSLIMNYITPSSTVTTSSEQAEHMTPVHAEMHVQAPTHAQAAPKPVALSHKMVESNEYGTGGGVLGNDSDDTDMGSWHKQC